MERRATEKVNDIKRIEQKKEKEQGTTVMLQTKAKIEQEVKTGKVP